MTLKPEIYKSISDHLAPNEDTSQWPKVTAEWIETVIGFTTCVEIDKLHGQSLPVEFGGVLLRWRSKRAGFPA